MDLVIGYIQMNQTIEYYNRNAGAFCESTIHADMSYCRNRFLQYLSPGAYILDAGCGSGRDSRHFLEQGFRIEAFDAAEEICRLAEGHIGQPVKCMRFEDMEYEERFDGIWACASLLHINREILPQILRRLHRALMPMGILYASFKYGDTELDKGERYFINFTEDGIIELLEASAFTVLECFVTSDVREGRSAERWVNVIGRRRQAYDSLLQR